jgi:hypothetical protein
MTPPLRFRSSLWVIVFLIPEDSAALALRAKSGTLPRRPRRPASQGRVDGPASGAIGANANRSPRV